MQSTSEVLPVANQDIQKERNWHSNQHNIQVQGFGGGTSQMMMLPQQHLDMGQHGPYMTGGQQQEQWQEYQLQQQLQQQLQLQQQQKQQQFFLSNQIQQLNPILQQQMQMVLPTEHQQHQQQQHLFPNQIEQFEQQMQIVLPGHGQPQQLQQQEQQFNNENFQQQDFEHLHLRYQEDSQRMLLSRHQQKPVNQHGNQQWQQGKLQSGL
jgi:hypothetical protein